eukprot:SAG11_NODE_9632_length_893_cov_2.680101_2_plen_213_part_01
MIQLKKTVEQAGVEGEANDDDELGTEFGSEFGGKDNRAAVERLVRALFDRTDTNHDDSLSRDELNAMLDRPEGSAFGKSLTKKEREELIDYIDSDSDGKISREEFVKALMLHRETYIHASSEEIRVEFVAGEDTTGKKCYAPVMRGVGEGTATKGSLTAGSRISISCHPPHVGWHTGDKPTVAEEATIRVTKMTHRRLACAICRVLCSRGPPR